MESDTQEHCKRLKGKGGNMRQGIVYLHLVIVLFSLNAYSRVVEYEMDISYKTVNFTGKDIQAIAVGGQIPAPTLEFKEGDTLKVTFHNKLKESTSVHWHGLLVPNDQDGVPFLTNFPIESGGSFTYSFPLKHTGTYWYHSHTGFQEQLGVYGAIVIHPKEKKFAYDREKVVILSDWIDENPLQVLKNLKKSGDYYALKKGSVQPWKEVIENDAIMMRLKQSWNRMGPMDLSDVGYDAFLVNGLKTSNDESFIPGERVRLRIINAGASTYFRLGFAKEKMRVVSADGVDIVPLEVDELMMAVAETYDVIVRIPDHGAYEFRATAQDGTGMSSIFLGKGHQVFARHIPRPNPFKMGHGDHGGGEGGRGGGNDGGHGSENNDYDVEYEDNMMLKKLDYSQLRSPVKTELSNKNPIKNVRLELTGNMKDYIWTFNGLGLKESDKIRVKKGENVRFHFINKTMMHHPLHLHGHFFRVVNKHGEYSPLKHTVDIKPMSSQIIEFYANEEKDWFFHCHNLYHVRTGMARVVGYEGSEINKDLALAKEKYNVVEEDDWYFQGEVDLNSNYTEGSFRASNNRNVLEIEGKLNYEDEEEAEFTYERRINKPFNPYLRAKYENNEDDEVEWKGVIGITYTLPLLIESEFGVDSNGHTVVGLSSELDLTNRVQFGWEYEYEDTESDYSIGLDYQINKSFSIKANYGTEDDFGLGVNLKF